MDFDNSVIDGAVASLNGELARPQIVVTDEELARERRRMEAVGYDFKRTPNGAVALRHYLEGKSLLLAGNAGTGKTSFFEALNRSGVAACRIRVLSLLAHGTDYVSAIVDELRGYEADEVVVDDVGGEAEWQQRQDALLRIIAVREASPRRTHFTTNLNKGQLEKLDERVRSRLKVCVCVPFVGNDNRQPTANKELVSAIQRGLDPANWTNCAERCPMFMEGRCTAGFKASPQMLDRTPEEVCGVGREGGIPYRDGYLEREREQIEAAKRDAAAIIAQRRAERAR